MVKVVKLLLGAGSLVSGLGLAPMSVGAADPPPLQGNVSTSTVDISVSPRALLNVPTALLNGLPALGALNGALDKVSIKLDTSTAQGILTADRNDLDTAHAVSNVVDVNIKGLDEILNTLTGAIGGLTGTLTSAVPTLAGPASQQLGAITGLLNNLTSQLGSLNLHKAAVADLVHGGPGATQGSNVVDNLSLPPSLSLTLAPFAATATNAATKLAGITGPQAEAHSTTENLAIAPGLPGLPDVQNIIGQLQQLISGLNGIAGSVTATEPVATVITTLQNAPAPISGITQSLAQNLQKGDTVTQVTGQLNGVLDTLKGLLGQVTTLLNLKNLDLNKLVQAGGITTSSLLQPAGGAVHGLATSKFTDIKLLQLVGDQLASLLGTPLNTPLIEVSGAQSTAEATVDGTDASAPTGSSKLGSINVLGRPVIDLNSVIAPGTTKTVPVDLGAFALTLQVTAGVPTIANSSPTHKSVQVGALEVSLLNGRPDGSGQIPLLGSGGVSLASTGVLSHAALAATGSNAIVRASFASSAVDVAAGPLNSTSASSPQPQGELPKTGKFGPLALGIGAVLLAAGLSLRFIPGAVGRLRRSGQ